MLGAQDCAWMISKKDRFDNEATLYITGRDLESRNLKIEFKKDVFRWVYIGTAEDIEDQRFQAEYDQSPIVETIKKLVKTRQRALGGIRTGDQERKQVSGLGDIRRCSEDWQTNQKIRAFVFS